MENKKISEFEKTDDKKIIFSMVEGKKDIHIDIREWVESDSYKGFTKKGIRFHVEHWEEFVRAIKELESKLNEQIYLEEKYEQGS